MKKYFLLIIITMLFSCKGEKPTFYFNSKWKIQSRINQMPLKRNPLEVKETLYSDLNDTTINTKGRFGSYTITNFNDSGQIIYEKVYIDDNIWHQVFTTYNEDGFYIHSKNYSGKDTNSVLNKESFSFSRSLPNGKFEVISSDSLNSKKIKITSFSFDDNGNIEETDFVEPTQQIKGKDLTYFKNGIIQKSEQNTSDGQNQLVQYFYSKNNFLDSVKHYRNNKLFSQQIFLTNEYGDPITYIEISDKNDTTEITEFQYQYDKNGNWITELEKRIKSEYSYPGIYKIVPGINETANYSLAKREIKYPSK